MTIGEGEIFGEETFFDENFNCLILNPEKK